MTTLIRPLLHYYVDEGGDSNLFNRHGTVIVGSPGCSKFFVLGLLRAADPPALGSALESLRAELLADPYFKGVPSMLPEQRKTAVAFHAKDDPAEVRREVFRLLLAHDVRFFAVVRDKARIVKLVREHNAKQGAYRYHPNQLYDRCTTALFRDRLNADDAYRIVFAKRGAADRTEALSHALGNARQSFRLKWGRCATSPIEVVPSVPSQEVCLQAADYFIWALQRLFEKQEDRFWRLVWPKVAVVQDVDDVRRKPYGEYYSQDTPLTLAALSVKSPGI